MRLLQISDCHLLANPEDRCRGYDTHGSLADLLSYIDEHEQHADALVFTGDISQQGNAQSYAHLESLLSFTDKPVYALPGNHDDALVMREQMQRVQCGHSAELGGWQILLLDSPVMDEEHGEISAADLNWLALWLKTSGDKPTLLAVHHQPVAVGCAWMDEIGLRNGAELLNLLKDYEHVKGLIFGHVHQAFDSQFQHIRILGCPSSCFQYQPQQDEFSLDEEQQPGYRWLELNADGSLETGITRMPSFKS